LPPFIAEMLWLVAAAPLSAALVVAALGLWPLFLFVAFGSEAEIAGLLARRSASFRGWSKDPLATSLLAKILARLTFELGALAAANFRAAAARLSLRPLAVRRSGAWAAAATTRTRLRNRLRHLS